MRLNQFLTWHYCGGLLLGDEEGTGLGAQGVQQGAVTQPQQGQGKVGLGPVVGLLEPHPGSGDKLFHLHQVHGPVRAEGAGVSVQAGGHTTAGVGEVFTGQGL